MNDSTKLKHLRMDPESAPQLPVVMGFGSLQSFELMQRAAKLLASSTLVPTAYRSQKEIKDYGKVVGYEDNPSAVPNCVVALNMSQRMNADPLMIMQNLHIIEGRPSWSSTYIIACINSCGKYSPLRFDLSKPSEPREVTYLETKWEAGKKVQVSKTIKVRDRTCIAWVIERETGERLESPEVSIEMAEAEGWLTKNGSKWQTIPDLMLRYRTAAFFGRLYAPELLMGLQSAEEVGDLYDAEPDGKGGYSVNLETLRANPASNKKDSPDYVAPLQESLPDDAPDLNAALAAVKSGDMDLAQDIASGLDPAEQTIVAKAIDNQAHAEQKPEPKPEPVTRSRDRQTAMTLD